MEKCHGFQARYFADSRGIKRHQNALVKAVSFMNVYSGEEKNIKSSISKSYEDNVIKNRAILSGIITVVVALGNEIFRLEDTGGTQ